MSKRDDSPVRSKPGSFPIRNRAICYECREWFPRQRMRKLNVHVCRECKPGASLNCPRCWAAHRKTEACPKDSVKSYVYEFLKKTEAQLKLAPGDLSKRIHEDNGKDDEPVVVDAEANDLEVLLLRKGTTKDVAAVLRKTDVQLRMEQMVHLDEPMLDL